MNTKYRPSAVEQKVFKLLDEQGMRSNLAKSTSRFLKLMSKHDKKTFLHECRVSLIAIELARFCKYEDVKPEFFGGANHDVGKLIISGELLKKDSITEAEYGIIKEHATKSAQMLEKYPFTAFIAGSHHNHQKNSYGTGIDGDNLPSGAHIATNGRMKDAALNVALADFFDAATTRKTQQMGAGGEDSSRERMEVEYPSMLDRIEFLFESADIRAIFS